MIMIVQLCVRLSVLRRKLSVLVLLMSMAYVTPGTAVCQQIRRLDSKDNNVQLTVQFIALLSKNIVLPLWIHILVVRFQKHVK